MFKLFLVNTIKLIVFLKYFVYIDKYAEHPFIFLFPVLLSHTADSLLTIIDREREQER